VQRFLNDAPRLSVRHARVLITVLSQPIYKGKNNELGDRANLDSVFP